MNSSIKARQTRLINWLNKTLSCKHTVTAETGSCYVEYNTQYTGKAVVRISDHLSADRTYIHVLLSPLNTNVIINYKNFVWNGNFGMSKLILYSLIMSKAMTDVSEPMPAIPVVPTPSVKKKVVAKQQVTPNCVYAQGCSSKGFPVKLSELNETEKQQALSFVVKKNKTKAKTAELLYVTERQFKALYPPEIPKETIGVVKTASNDYYIPKEKLLTMSPAMQHEVSNWLHIDSIESIKTSHVLFTKPQYELISLYI